CRWSIFLVDCRQESSPRLVLAVAATVLPPGGHNMQCRVTKCEHERTAGSRLDLGLNWRGFAKPWRLLPDAKKIRPPPLGGCAPTHSLSLFGRDWAGQPVDTRTACRKPV